MAKADAAESGRQLTDREKIATEWQIIAAAIQSVEAAKASGYKPLADFFEYQDVYEQVKESWEEIKALKRPPS